MKKIGKAGLSCILALTVAAPVLLVPAAAKAAPAVIAAAQKKSYTAAERAYMKYQSNVLYKLRTQTEDIMKLMDQADQYEDEKFMLLLDGKMHAWEQSLKEAQKYRPQDAPAKFKKAQGFFSQAVTYSTKSCQLVKDLVQKGMNGQEPTEKELNVWAENFVGQYVAFKTKSAAFDEEIKKLNKIYR